MNVKREMNPQYIAKLEWIQNQKGIRFETIEDFELFFSFSDEMI